MSEIISVSGNVGEVADMADSYVRVCSVDDLPRVGAVQPALDLAILDVALGQGHVGVAAGVVDGVDSSSAVTHDGDRLAGDVHLQGTDLRQVIDGTDTHETIGHGGQLPHVAVHGNDLAHADSAALAGTTPAGAEVAEPNDKDSSASMAVIR